MLNPAEQDCIPDEVTTLIKKARIVLGEPDSTKPIYLKTKDHGNFLDAGGRTERKPNETVVFQAQPQASAA